MSWSNACSLLPSQRFLLICFRFRLACSDLQTGKEPIRLVIHLPSNHMHYFKRLTTLANCFVTFVRSTHRRSIDISINEAGIHICSTFIQWMRLMVKLLTNSLTIITISLIRLSIEIELRHMRGYCINNTSWALSTCLQSLHRRLLCNCLHGNRCVLCSENIICNGFLWYACKFTYGVYVAPEHRAQTGIA